MHSILLPAAILFLVTVRVVINALSNPLRHVPGPFWARFTRLYYIKGLLGGNYELENVDLHRQLAKPEHSMAPLVRLGPDLYSLASPDRTVYGFGNTMPKSDWYHAWNNTVQNKENLFSERDEPKHSQQRRKFSSMYALSSLLQYENYVDETISTLRRKLLEFAEHDQPVDLTKWMQYYAFDVIGAITYGKTFGFLDQGRDIANMIDAIHSTFAPCAILGVYPWMFFAFFRIQQLLLPASPNNGLAYMAKILSKHISDRFDQRSVQEKNLNKDAEDLDDKPMDMLDKVLESKNNPSELPELARLMSGQNVTAGSDTTAISLSSCVYYLVRNPWSLAVLHSELHKAMQDGKLTAGGISFKHTLDMPYLQACIKESLRLHPAVGLPMWRVVPSEGATISGQDLPGGSVVGTNPWVSHRNQDVWGLDADEFRPERWIEASESHRKVMEVHWIPFGLGSRTCIGRHIAELEMCKVLPVIMNEFEILPTHGEEPWRTSNAWFVFPESYKVVVKRRFHAPGDKAQHLEERVDKATTTT